MSSDQTNPCYETLLGELAILPSEQVNPNSEQLDTLNTFDLLTLINQQDHLVAPAIKAVIPHIAECVEHAVKSIKSGGRLIYIGAGTSGRLGILDAAECRPTFSVPDNIVVGLIAGGEAAIQHAVEGAEDNAEQSVRDLKAVHLCSRDTLVGIAASGRTPYVIAALDYAKSIGVKTVSITTNKAAPMLATSDVGIAADVGPEVLTGSTRMKAGTAQKLILNMISTATMVKLGKTYGNLMVDVNASNAKLKARAIRIVMQATECSSHEAQRALTLANDQAKLAILIVLTGLSAEQASKLLSEHNGYVRQALSEQMNN
jgi:N-acetylmuramic acid 6-phosphate etherase